MWRLNGTKIQQMKRSIPIFIITAMLALSSCSLNPGKTSNVTIDLGESSKFSEKEIQQAVNCVLKKFTAFEGCELEDIWYDEKLSNREYGEDNILHMVLLSNFRVDENGGDGSMEPNSYYSKWRWLLARDNANSKWMVQDWGY